MKKVRWLHDAMGRAVGQVEDLESEHTDAWIRAGLIEPVEPDEGEED